MNNLTSSGACYISSAHLQQFQQAPPAGSGDTCSTHMLLLTDLDMRRGLWMVLHIHEVGTRGGRGGVHKGAERRQGEASTAADALIAQ